MADIRSTQELYDLAKNEVQAQDPTLTDFNDGSLLDILTGVMATMIGEANRITLDSFAKTFVETSNGPEVTGGPDDLERLLVDHFGIEFSRPTPKAAEGVVVFTRPSATAGSVLIPAGTIVKTPPNAAGTSIRFATEVDVTMLGLTVSVAALAVLSGTAGNVQASTVTQLESTLTDQTIVVANLAAFTGGTDTATDAQYREYARNLLQTIRGMTAAAIRAKALTVAGVVQAVPVELLQTVIQYDPGSNTTSGSAFQIARVYLYISDANGTANAALVAAVKSAINSVRAEGILVQVIGAAAIAQSVTASFTLNGSGPNFASLSQSLAPIVQDLIKYIQNLPIGTGFSRSSAKTAIMAIWGPTGSNDLADMTIISPTADVAITSVQKLIPGTVVSQ